MKLLDIANGYPVGRSASHTHSLPLTAPWQVIGFCLTLITTASLFGQTASQVFDTYANVISGEIRPDLRPKDVLRPSLTLGGQYVRSHTAHSSSVSVDFATTILNRAIELAGSTDLARNHQAQRSRQTLWTGKVEWFSNSRVKLNISATGITLSHAQQVLAAIAGNYKVNSYFTMTANVGYVENPQMHTAAAGYIRRAAGIQIGSSPTSPVLTATAGYSLRDRLNLENSWSFGLSIAQPFRFLIALPATIKIQALPHNTYTLSYSTTYQHGPQPTATP